MTSNVMEEAHLETGGPTGTSGITSMNAEGSTVQSTLAKAINIAKFWRKSASSTRNQEIADFLKRPIIIQSGVLSSTDTISTFGLVNCPTAFYSDVLIKRKLEGSFGLRATMVFTLQVNANRFQQGRYILAFIRQFGGANLNGPTNPAQVAAMNDWVFGHMATLTQVTQLPHVELDVNCDTVATLRVPYVSCYDYWDVANMWNLNNIAGQLRLIPYSAIQSGPNAINTAGYTIWGHLEDVEIEGTAYQQMGTLSEEEQQSKGIGPVASAAGQVAKFSNAVMKIPGLSAYAAPVAWASEQFKNVALAMGWSKPAMLEHIMRVQSNSLAYAHNVDNPDNSLAVSLYARNQVENITGFAGTDIDEMSIDFLKTIPAYIQTITWAKTATSGTNLVTYNVTPNIGILTQNFGSVPLKIVTPMGFLSRLFGYWRGGIVFRIKIVKTEFHSGRLAIYFQPNDDYQSAPYVPTLTDSRYLQRDILDIRESNIIELVVPYTSLTPYRKTEGSYTSTGTFVVSVLDPLVSPDTATSSITLLVEIAGAQDMEFQVPTSHTSSVIMGVTPQSGFEVDECSTVQKALGGMVQQPFTSGPSRACMGEHIRSLRSLAKMHRFHSSFAVNNTNTFLAYPFDITYGSCDGTTLTQPLDSDFLSVLGCIYGISRGGVRVKLCATSNTNGTSYFTLPTVWNCLPNWDNDRYTSTVVNGGWMRNNASYVASMFSNGLQAVDDMSNAIAGEYVFPQYTSLNGRISANHLQPPLVAAPNFVGVPRSSLVAELAFYPYISGNTYVIAYGRSASDDFTAGGFLSIPPLSFLS